MRVSIIPFAVYFIIVVKAHRRTDQQTSYGEFQILPFVGNVYIALFLATLSNLSCEIMGLCAETGIHAKVS